MSALRHPSVPLASYQATPEPYFLWKFIYTVIHFYFHLFFVYCFSITMFSYTLSLILPISQLEAQ